MYGSRSPEHGLEESVHNPTAIERRIIMSSVKLDMDSVTGNDKGVLSSCNFLPVGSGKYHLRQSGTVVKANVTDGADFVFKLGGFTWNVTNFKINDKEASGHWTNDDPESPAAGGDYSIEETGTFHAQAGGAQVPLPEDAIIIDEIKIGNGRPIRGGELFGCYFVKEVDSDDYNFFSRNGKQLKSKIKSGVSFDFDFQDNAKPGWQMTADFHIENLKRVAHGDWTFIGDNEDGDNDDGADDEDGTFHAQAGGGGMDNYRASSAKAY
jgi:hypothetical protein